MNDALAIEQGDLRRTGCFPMRGPARPPRLRWQFPTQGHVTSSPVVWGDTVYFGSEDGRVYAVNVQTGRKRWQFRTRGPVWSSPTVMGGEVFCGSSDGKFYVLDAETGKKRRHFDARLNPANGKRMETEFGTPALLQVNSSAVIAEGIACFWSLLDHDEEAEENADDEDFADDEDWIEPQDTLFAIEVSSGALLWQHPISSGGGMLSAAVSEGAIYICEEADGHGGSRCYALDLHTGEKRWEYHDLLGGMTPLVTGGRMLCGAWGQRILALNKLDGTRLGSAGTLDSPSAAVVNDTIFIAGLDNDSDPSQQTPALQAVALTPENGDCHSVQWSHVLDAWPHRGGNVCVAEGIVYAFCTNDLYACAMETGERLWTFQAPDAIQTSLFVADGALFFGCGHALCALE